MLKEEEMEKSSGSMNKGKNLAELLGFPKESILLMIHADDAGLSQAHNQATIEALEHGSVNSMSLMVPCPWFLNMVNCIKEHPHVDYGVHLTLTCEWQDYKFGPVLPITEVSSLVDQHGFFYKTRNDILEKADPKEVKKELRAQIDRALSYGLNPSHLDSHMYSLGISKPLIEVYQELGDEYGLPIMLNKQLIGQVSGNPSLANAIKNKRFVDYIHLGDYAAFTGAGLSSYYEAFMENLDPGFNLILIHPAFNTAEMQAICREHPNFGAEWRQIDFDFFTSETCKKIIEKRNIKMITWKDIQQIVQA